jgi:hypothetical protein
MTREQIETLKDLHARLTVPRDWQAEAEDRRTAARRYQSMTRADFGRELATIQAEDPDLADACAELRADGPRKMAAEYRRLAEDAASGRSARMLADLAAQVWEQIIALEAGGTPIKRRLGR